MTSRGTKPPPAQGQRAFVLVLLAFILGATLLRARQAAADDPIHHAVSGLVGDLALDRATPRRALKSFLEAARDGDFTTAAHCLDLRGETDPSRGSDLAEELSYVLYRRKPIDLSQIPDEPTASDGQVTVETFTVGEQEVPLQLARVRFEDGIHRWVIARATVRRIPDIAATMRTHVWETRLPEALRGPVVLGNAPWQWLGIVVAVFVAYLLATLFAAACTRVAGSIARRTSNFVDGSLLSAARRPLRTIFAASLFGVFAHLLQTSLAVTTVLEHVAYTGFVVGCAWLLLAAFNLFARAVGVGVAADATGAENRPGERTRRALLQRVASASIIGVTIAILLLQFDVVRHVGLSLLASAGIVGVVVGLAAQKSLAGVIAGVQLSITQPLRLGDTIFIEGEMGLVEDIFLTYAVIRFWDDRCVVVPLSRFLEQPFQNWTLLHREVKAVVLLHVKFTAPIEVVRQKAHELCAGHLKSPSPSVELHVSDSDMYGMVLRIMAPARSPAEAWELRCMLREGIISFLQTLDGGAHLG